MTVPPVPDQLVGCWRRALIRSADGSVDDRSDVIWLQTRSAMADLRLDGERPDLSSRSGVGACDHADLVSLAGSDSSTGYTLVDVPTRRLLPSPPGTRVDEGVDFQPVLAFPEPGLLTGAMAAR